MANRMTNLSRHKLSKRFLMDAIPGYWIVSNVFSEDIYPEFYEAVEPIEARDAQWNRIKAARADQRNCLIFKTKKEADEWIEEMLELFNR